MALTPALAAVLPVLRCPVCAMTLHAGKPAGQPVRCERGHAYDVARQGYLNLATGKAGPGTGDTSEMVAARSRFLAAGHYQPIATALAGVVHEFLGSGSDAKNGSDAKDVGDDDDADGGGVGGPIADLGGGTGYYLARVLDEQPSRLGICLDLSVPALRAATRAHSRLASVGSDVWQHLPLADRSIAALFSVFAPRNGAEALRCLVSGGLVVVVTPQPDHLAEVIDQLGMIAIAPDKEERLEAQFAGFSLAGQSLIRYQAEISREDLADLVLMGPSARHVTRPEVEERLRRRPEPQTVTISVRVQAFREVLTRAAPPMPSAR